MMNANELRLGNFVLEESKRVQLSEDDLEVLFAARNYADYEPIPLTPEILEKCGFEKGEKGFWFTGGIEYNLEKNLLEGFGYCLIEYLHQLQNLYFALTGEELQITL